MGAYVMGVNILEYEFYVSGSMGLGWVADESKGATCGLQI